MYKKIIATGIATILLSGCTAGFRPALEDYKGADAARIRASTMGNTALQFYEKQPSGCYKKVLERRITSGFALIGIPVTGNKRLADMPASQNVSGPFINEFTIKPGQLIDVVHYASRWTYANFIPQPNHNYDIVVTGSLYAGDSVSVKDIDTSEKIVTWKTEDVKLCPGSVFD
ncbi:hypothetical protein RI049_10320 [Cedecea neteri]|uniref:hypothetical protein n=1 Tax=Cedecea neteri TaxID=158822 RepID=UPI0005D9E5EB|nr:hypothetical protein [Cedecea neteri]AJZ89832.1 hypothetical protein VW41_12720 [Klebsiella michiganensis]WPU25103.1 hypothetical protein RI049_10320 [Cedecea neteri]